MADDQEKTEEPTSKKIEDARKEGNVPKSQDTNGFVTLVIGIAVTFLMLPIITNKIKDLYIYYMSFIGQEIGRKEVFAIWLKTLMESVLMVMPIAISVAIAGVIASTMQFGFLFTPKSIMPKLSKINPLKGLKQLFSFKKLIEGVKIVLKVGSVFGVAFYFLLSFSEDLTSMPLLSISAQLDWLKEKAAILIAVMIALLLVLAVIDLMFVRYNYFKELKMSKQEIKDEYKQMEGDPRVKARIRRVQMEMSRKRMMQNIPDADVVITNPTHYAVAIRYDQSKDKAPVVVAKGVDFLALRIKEVALNNNIQIVENPPLARKLYAECDVDKQIPEMLYKAVAEVLAFVFKANANKKR